MISTGLLILCGIVCFCWIVLAFFKSRSLPPGPWAWLVIGNIRMFQKDPQGYKKFTELAKKYGNIYRLYCGSTMIVMLNGYDAIHEAFTKQADIFTDRPQLFVPLIGVSKGTGLTYNSGHAWKTLRRFTLQALRDFGVGKMTLEDRIKDEINVLASILSESRQLPIRMKPYLLSAATNIICSVMFGARFDYSDARFTELTQVLEGIFKLNAPFAKENFFPQTRNWESGKELIRKRTEAIERVKRYLSETIEEHKATFDPEIIRDFIDLYIKASRDDTDPELFTEQNVYKIIVDLFLAGGETTGTSLDWALLYMIEYPDIQERCYGEIRQVVKFINIQVVGSNNPVSLMDRPSMDYVQATLLELQRVSNTLTFSLPHVASTEAKLMGYHIPKDTIVIANLYSAHMDPKYWSDPGEFRPQRFLNEIGHLTRKEGLVPFGDGPRLCIGEPLARMELFLIFTNLLQKFKFIQAEGEHYSLDAYGIMKGVIVGDLGGAKIRVGVDVGPVIVPNIMQAPPEVIKGMFDELPNMKLRADDIMLCTYQKTGTNWLYEILSMINSRSADRVKSNKVQTMIECVPQNVLEQAPSPRVLNSHLRPSSLPTGLRGSHIKTVLCVRNPKDTAVSFYHHMKGLHLYDYNGKFADWLPLYLQGKLEYGTYTEYLKEWEKVIQEGPDFPLHIIYFEDLKVDGVNEIDKLLKFMEVEMDDKLKNDISEACNFDKMAAEKLLQVPKELMERTFKPDFNFYRKGEIGDWKNWFTVAQNEMFDSIWEPEMKDSNMFEFIYTDPRRKLN